MSFLFGLRIYLESKGKIRLADKRKTLGLSGLTNQHLGKKKMSSLLLPLGDAG